MAAGTGSPCGACKFLRRKCALDCIFAPYFCSEQGVTRFAAIHKIFGASNVSKLLLHVPFADRCEAVVTIAYEAQARIQNPVYGCVGHIFALQQEVASLHAQLIQAKAQLANNLVESRLAETHWPRIVEGPPRQCYSYVHTMSPQSSLDCIDHNTEALPPPQHEMFYQEDLALQPYAKKRMVQNEPGELQSLAIRMMRN